MEPRRRVVDRQTILLAIRQDADDRYRTGRRRGGRSENGLVGSSGTDFWFHDPQTSSTVNRSILNLRTSALDERTMAAERWAESHVVPAMTDLQTGPLQWSRDMAARCRLLATRSARLVYTQHLLSLADGFDADVAKLSLKGASSK
jgi:hypothetical protein